MDPLQCIPLLGNNPHQRTVEATPYKSNARETTKQREGKGKQYAHAVIRTKNRVLKEIWLIFPKWINNHFVHSEKQLFWEIDIFLLTLEGILEPIYIYMFTYFSPCLDGKDACWKLIYDKAVEYKQKYNVQHIYVGFHKVYLPKVDRGKTVYSVDTNYKFQFVFYGGCLSEVRNMKIKDEDIKNFQTRITSFVDKLKEYCNELPMDHTYNDYVTRINDLVKEVFDSKFCAKHPEVVDKICELCEGALKQSEKCSKKRKKSYIDEEKCCPNLNMPGYVTMCNVPFDNPENILKSLHKKFPIPSDGWLRLKWMFSVLKIFFKHYKCFH
ncbi:uncharacterized protein LOC124464171 [Hypomesus transpacificus]|uniref:uncharacterized protein LOC124464171 n=1 Tax=Hypomesus transpacificus TaxID=137520 RepID=UPI001F07D2A0|nr:uncharacterized protein LOC124464171 [Hypomesus transpacificus]